MTQYIPHLVLAGGVWLIIGAAMISAVGWLNGLLFRLVPAVLGALLLLVASMMYMGATP